MKTTEFEVKNRCKSAEEARAESTAAGGKGGFKGEALDAVAIFFTHF